MKSNPTIYNFVLVFLVLQISCSIVFAQKKEKNQLYLAWVKHNKTGTLYNGYLTELTDSSIWIDQRLSGKVFADYPEQYFEILYRDIDKFQIRKKSAKRKGALIGAFFGIALATVNLIGLYSGDNDLVNVFVPVPVVIGEEMLIIGIGTGIGVGIGSIKKKILIYNEPERYPENKNLLIEYARQSMGNN